MKYLKLFEANWIKHTDENAIKNPLRDFSRKFEDFTLTLSIPNRINIRRYFKNNNGIDINFSDNHYIFLRIKMNLFSDIINLEIIYKESTWYSPTPEEITNFYNFLIDQLKKFKHDPISKTTFECEIPFDKKDDILNDLINNYELYLSYRKYNL